MVVDYHGPTKLRREFQRDAGGISQAIATSPAARKCSYTLRPASLWAGLQPALQPQSNKAAALAQSRLLYGLLNGWKSESLSLDGGFAAGKQVRDMPDQAFALRCHRLGFAAARAQTFPLVAAAWRGRSRRSRGRTGTSGGSCPACSPSALGRTPPAN